MTKSELRFLRKLPEKFPDHLRAVDVAILRSQQQADDARKAGVGKAAGHAVAALVDAIEHDGPAAWAARGHPRHRGRVRRIAVLEFGHIGLLRNAAIDAPPEI